MDAGLEAEEDVCGGADWDSSPFLCPDREQMRLGSFRLPEDPSAKGPWSQRSQRSISRSLQRAEVLLRSTFHPSLKWLFRSHSLDEEEEHFVVAQNLVSRSSARLLRLQQVLLTVAPQGRLSGDTQGQGAALWRLVLQRSLLLFTHEYTRRARLAAAFICSLQRLLQRLLPDQIESMLSSVGTELSLLCQELRIHLNHWSCLFSRVQSDACLRLALIHQAALLMEIRQTLDCLGLQALVLTERCVSSALSAVALVDLDSVAPKVLEDILTGTDLYNQAVEDQRTQYSVSQLRAAVLRRAHHPRPVCRLMKSQNLHPSAFSMQDLLRILAVHHAETAAKQLHRWLSQQNCQQAAGRRLEPRPEPHVDWARTWEQQALLFLAPLCSDSRTALQPSHCQTCSHTPGSAPEPPAGRSLNGACQSQLSYSGVDVQLRSPGLQGCRAEALFQLLVSSNDRLARRRPPDATSSDSPGTNATDSVMSSKPTKDRKQEGAEPEAARSELRESCCFQERPPAEELDSVRWPHSVQWSDLGQGLALADLTERYQSVFRSLCRDAVWLQLFVPPAGGATDSINLQGWARGFQSLRCVRRAPHSGQSSEECKAMLEDFSEYLLVITAHTHWDHVLCRSLGSALKDKCESDQSRSLQDTTSLSMERFLSLPPPLLSALSCQQPHGSASGLLAGRPGTTHTVSLVLASVQLSTVWVMSKAYQFLSSWNLKKFLLVTQGDLKMLRTSSQLLLHQTRAMVQSSHGENCSSLQNHARRLLRLQLGELDRSVSELQTFSSRVLRSFSTDCKRMSGEIFERTMPSAVHWRPGHRTGFPSCPSEYASLAAQTVIGQVLEGVAPLPDDVRVQALSITMTAFMEAWMEHILRQKIKFSVQGALQLKQDFDCIREMIQADRYGLSAELHQRLLGLR